MIYRHTEDGRYYIRHGRSGCFFGGFFSAKEAKIENKKYLEDEMYALNYVLLENMNSDVVKMSFSEYAKIQTDSDHSMADIAAMVMRTAVVVATLLLIGLVW